MIRNYQKVRFHHYLNKKFILGKIEAEAIIKNLDGSDPLLYAALKAIGPLQLTEEEVKNAILLVDYYKILTKTGWPHPYHPISLVIGTLHCGRCVSYAKKKILGVTSRYVMMLKQ